MNAKTAKLRKKLNDKRYRDAFVASQISVGVPFQVRALRTKKGWDQKELAQRTGMAQPRISAIETPGVSSLNLKTLRRIASGFDVGLIVRFAPFSELIRFADDFSPDEFQVLDFYADMAATYDGKISNTADVISIFTGKRLKVVPGERAKPERSVVTTKQALIQQPLINRKYVQSAETKSEYSEVKYG